MTRRFLIERGRGGVARDLDRVDRMQARVLTSMFAAVTLDCVGVDLYGAERRFWVTTSRSRFAAARDASLPVMHGAQWNWLTHAAERQEACLAVQQWLVPVKFVQGTSPWDIAKPHTPLERLLGVLHRGHCQTPISVHDVLAHFGAELAAADPDLEVAAAHADAEGLL